MLPPEVIMPFCPPSESRTKSAYAGGAPLTVAASRHALAVVCLPLLLALAGCEDDHDDDRDSVVVGSIAQATFPRDVERITVREVDQGAVTTAEVEADGSFEAELRAGGTYRLLLSPSGERWPIALRSGLGRLDTTVFVATGGALADIGEVRFWSGGTPGRAAVVGVEGEAPALCEAGLLETGEPCATGEAAVVCEEKHGKGHRKHHHRDHGDDHDGHDEARCMDGLDAQGQICNGGPTAFDASAFEPQAIPGANLPEQLACLGDDHHDDDDHDHDDDD